MRSGRVTRRSQLVERDLTLAGELGKSASDLPQTKRSPDGISAASKPYFLISSLTATSREQRRECTLRGHGSSTGAGTRIVLSGVSCAWFVGRKRSTARERSRFALWIRL